METMNKLMTLDGLIERLQEIRDTAGRDLPIIAETKYGCRKTDSVITMVCLETKNGSDNAVSVVIEKKDKW